MLRVVRSGGTIALANWTPAGFIGRLFGVIGRHVPPPAGVTPPSRWGMPEHLELLFGAEAAQIRTTPRDFMFRYRSAAHWIDVFRTWYGPVHKAFAALPPDGPGPPRRRPARPHRRVQRRRRRHDGGAGRVPRGCDCEAVGTADNSKLQIPNFKPRLKAPALKARLWRLEFEVWS